MTAAQSWRLWLLNGTRRGRVDRRRVRGAHLGLKRVLVSDLVVRGEPPYGWKEFSDAMLRHAIGDAVRMLPERDAHALKLAYFGGCSNRDIALEFGMTEAAVATRLRRALDFISDRIQRGGTTVRRAAYAVAAWFCGRWCESWLHHSVQASAAVAAAVIVVAGAPAPAAPPARHEPATYTAPSRSDVMAGMPPRGGPVLSLSPAPVTPTAASPVSGPGGPVLADPTQLSTLSAPAVSLPAPPVQVTVPSISVPVAIPPPPQPPLGA